MLVYIQMIVIQYISDRFDNFLHPSGPFRLSILKKIGILETNMTKNLHIDHLMTLG